MKTIIIVLVNKLCFLILKIYRRTMKTVSPIIFLAVLYLKFSDLKKILWRWPLKHLCLIIYCIIHTGLQPIMARTICLLCTISVLPTKYTYQLPKPDKVGNTAIQYTKLQYNTAIQYTKLQYNTAIQYSKLQHGMV